MRTNKSSVTHSLNKFLPAEWHPQSGVQLTWPHAGTDWAYILPSVEKCFMEIASEISKRELLLIVTPDRKEVESKIKEVVNMQNVRFLECQTNDTWARDHGAVTMIENGLPVVMDFTFNGWGLKFASNYDNQITRKALKDGILNGPYINQLDFVLEGGSFESDGNGTLLTTSTCLLTPNRNDHLTKEEIENYLKSVFNLKQVLWLDYGYLAGDDTDSHIDTLARFCSPDTIAYVKCTDEMDEHYMELKKMEEQLNTFRDLSGNPYRLLPLPMADEIVIDGERLPATYANFLIINGAVLFPTYQQPDNDSKAKEVLQFAFPTHEIIGIDCIPLIRQHGSLHSVTMQYPEKVIQ